VEPTPNLYVVSGSAHPALVEAVCADLGLASAARMLERFPDGEVRVVVREPVRGADVHVVQPLSPPADARLVELLFLADACRRGGAARVTAIVPYLAWARQDRRSADAEPHGARLVADLLCARLDHVLAVDVHARAAEGFFSVPFEHLTAVPALAAALAGSRAPVVVAPDLGAAKLAERVAARLGAPAACVHKERLSPTEVRSRVVSGEVAGRAPIVVDDMISTGATIEAAVKVLLEAGCRPDVTVAATHGLFVGDALERLGRLGLARVVVTDSVPPPRDPPFALGVVGLAPLLSEAIRRLRDGRPLAELQACT
jgi:ribose-phosphate pyrophosphokinase